MMSYGEDGQHRQEGQPGRRECGKGDVQSRPHLDAERVCVDHEVVEPLEDGVVVARLVAIADLVGLEVGEGVDICSL